MKNQYEQLYNFENLYTSHMIARKGKRYKREVMQFELELYDRLATMKRQLEQGSYQIDEYKSFTIYDPKERSIHAPSYRDRVMQHCLCDYVIAPALDNRMIYDNAASRQGKGTHFALDRVSRFFREHYRKYGTKGYILKCDISKYFDSIDHVILYNLLEKTQTFDKKTLELIEKIINSYQREKGKGLPLGNQSSQWFALFYLDEMDRLIKEKYRIKYYSRYMDDCVLIHHDRDYLKQCFEEMKAHIEEKRGLHFNHKTQIVPISQGVDYLGFHFYLTETGKVVRRLRTVSKKRFRRKMKAFKRAYANGKIQLTVISRSLAGYHGHLSHGHTYRLRKNIMKDFVLMKQGEER